MSESNDWSDAPQPEHQPPAKGEAASAHHPMANHEFDFEYFFQTLKLTATRLKEGPVLKAFVLLSIPVLIWGLMEGGLHSIGVIANISLFTGLFVVIVGLLLIPLWLALGALQVALYKPASRQFFTGQSPQQSPVKLVKSAVGDFVKAFVTLLGVGLATGLGSLCCVLPGLVAGFFLGQAPYLAVVRGQSIGEAFSNSIDRAQRHWHVVALTIGTNLLVVLVLAMAMGVLTVMISVAGNVWYPLALLSGPVVQWALGTAASVVLFVITIGAFGIIDELEGLDTISADSEVI